MKIVNSLITPRGDMWKIAGYSSPRKKGAPIYRLIRMSDGARVRVQSNKLYWLDLPKRVIEYLDCVPIGTNEMAFGRGATLNDDREKVGYYKNV